MLWFDSFAQVNSILSSSCVKENHILLRWTPSDKTIFDLGAKNGYKLTRYIKENNNLTAPIVVAENIRPRPEKDTLGWAKAIKKNSRAALAYNMIYASMNSANIPKKEKMQQEIMMYGLMLLSCNFDANIADACGLFFKDSTISKDKTYSYKIEINDLTASTKLAPATVTANSGILSLNPEIANLTGAFKNKTVKLTWKAIDFSNSYGGYNIERSEDQINFQRINTSPVILMSSQFEKKKEFISYTDTVPQAKIKYFYRIRGVNYFGEESAPSNVVSGTSYEELRSSPSIDSLRVVGNRKVHVHWGMSDPLENSLVREFVLLRSDKDNGKYSPLFKSSTEFTFADQAPRQSNYYKIGAITHGDDTLFSFSRLAVIIDTIPPVAPSGVKAKVDSKGNVEITWDKNPETDIKGYKIYKANDLNEEFVQINYEFAKNTSYKDKLNLKTLSRKIYYSVVATDNNYNSSELSKPIEIKRPDTIPPVSAIIKDLQISQKGIKVIWIPSSSEDARQYILYREKEKSTSVDQIRVWKPSDSTTTFLDTTLEFGLGYRYKIVVMDEDDNISVSNNPYMLFETGFRKKIGDIKFEVDRAKKVITLLWNYPGNEVEKYIVYRARSKEPLTIIQTIPHPASRFMDNTLNIGNTYEYRIKAVFKNGAESIISDAVIVEY